MYSFSLGSKTLHICAGSRKLNTCRTSANTLLGKFEFPEISKRGPHMDDSLSVAPAVLLKNKCTGAMKRGAHFISVFQGLLVL